MGKKERVAAPDSPPLDGSEGERKTEDEWFVRSDLWVADPALWACRRRGLGDYARFALMRYLVIKEPLERLDPDTIGRLPVKTWLGYVNKDPRKFTLSPTKQSEFDCQVADVAVRGKVTDEQRAGRLETLFDDPGLWPALAEAADQHNLTSRKRPWYKVKINPEILYRGRFAGSTAVKDYITYINTGIVPLRQAPFPDELNDLGVSFPNTFVGKVDYFRSDEREDIISDLAQHLALVNPDSPTPTGAGRITCLWSGLQPHGLVAACDRTLQVYKSICVEKNCRRLPIVYIPVGLDAKRRYVSRRTVVRDLYTKIRIARAKMRGEKTTPRELPINLTGEQVQVALSEVRVELARDPALLIFGIHQVPVTVPRAVAEEILDAPLPYILDRLMTETGEFGELTPIRNAHETQCLILADGELPDIANVPVTNFKLPQCPPERFEDLLGWIKYPRIEALRSEPIRPDEPLGNITTNEIELSIVESALALSGRSGEVNAPGGMADRVIRLVWGKDTKTSGKKRAEDILDIVANQILQNARTNVDDAWLATLLHIVSLIPGGLRLLTLARVIANYVTVTSPRPGEARSPTLQTTEVELWSMQSEASSLHEERRELQKRIVKYLMQFETQAIGLIRKFPSAAAAGFDEYPHPFESPEVPEYRFDFADPTQQLEFLSPFVRRTLCEHFRRSLPEKHALLHRLLAEEFTRRIVIVNAHRADRDVRSLVDKRYIILAIHCALESLKTPINGLLSETGQQRSRWLIPTHARLHAYYWVYRWLYIEQLNGGQHSLSEQHGAERLKRALLEQFLDADPQKTSFLDPSFLRRRGARSDLRHFKLISEILHGLIYVSVRTADPKLARTTFHSLYELTRSLRAAIADPGLPPQRRGDWPAALETISRQTAKLRMDAAVSYGAGLPGSGPDPVFSDRKKLFRDALDALADCTSEKPFDRDSVLAVIASVLRENRHQAPQAWSFARAIHQLRKHVPVQSMQWFYDYLLRYAELLRRRRRASSPSGEARPASPARPHLVRARRSAAPQIHFGGVRGVSPATELTPGA